jgi:hypothetical protein
MTYGYTTPWIMRTTTQIIMPKTNFLKAPPPILLFIFTLLVPFIPPPPPSNPTENTNFSQINPQQFRYTYIQNFIPNILNFGSNFR